MALSAILNLNRVWVLPAVIAIEQINTGIGLPPPLTPPVGAGNFFLGHFLRVDAHEK